MHIKGRVRSWDEEKLRWRRVTWYTRPLKFFRLSQSAAQSPFPLDCPSADRAHMRLPSSEERTEKGLKGEWMNERMNKIMNEWIKQADCWADAEIWQPAVASLFCRAAVVKKRSLALGVYNDCSCTFSEEQLPGSDTYDTQPSPTSPWDPARWPPAHKKSCLPAGGACEEH